MFDIAIDLKTIPDIVVILAVIYVGLRFGVRRLIKLIVRILEVRTSLPDLTGRWVHTKEDEWAQTKQNKVRDAHE